MKNLSLQFSALLLLISASVAQTSGFVDLTLPAPQERIGSGRGVPGFSNLSPMTLMPLNLKLEAMQPVLTGRTGVELVIAVRNLSDKEFEVPVGRDVEAITSDGHRHRNTFAFLVRALCDKCDRRQLQTIMLTASSSSSPSTEVVLRPNEEAHIKLFIDTSSYPYLPNEKTLDLQLGCQKIEFEDARYFIKSRSTISWLDLSVLRPRQNRSSQVK